MNTKIQVTTGIGSGPTDIAAFDAALIQAGIANYNLIKLSSVIPNGASVEVVDPKKVQPGGQWGDRLYIVMAEERVSMPNVEAWAGIGWAQEPETNRGLFVEHHGGSKITVERDIQASLEALFKSRGLKMGKVHSQVVGTICKREPVCALAVAVFETDDWAMNAPKGFFKKKNGKK